MLLRLREAERFPFPIASEGWQPLGLSAASFGRFEDLEALRAHLLELPGARLNGWGSVDWHVPEGGTLGLNVHDDGRAIGVDTHAPWEAVLELHRYVARRWPGVVIVDGGDLHDQASFQAFVDGRWSPDELPGRFPWRPREVPPGERPSLSELIAALEGSDQERKRAALEALRDMGPAGAGAAPHASVLLSAGYIPLQVEAAEALLAMGHGAAAVEPLVDALSRAARDPGLGWHRACAGLLGRIGAGAAGAVPALVKLLGDPDRHVRLAGAMALAALGTRAQAAVPALLAALEDPWPRVRRQAVRALVGLARDGDGIREAVLVLAADEDPEVAREVRAAFPG
jgi:hypothetical protein